MLELSIDYLEEKANFEFDKGIQDVSKLPAKKQVFMVIDTLIQDFKPAKLMQ